MYDANDPVENQRQRREVATLLRAAGMDAYAGNTLAILGGIAATNGGALRQAARNKGAIRSTSCGSLPWEAEGSGSSVVLSLSKRHTPAWPHWGVIRLLNPWRFTASRTAATVGRNG